MIDYTGTPQEIWEDHRAHEKKWLEELKVGTKLTLLDGVVGAETGKEYPPSTCVVIDVSPPIVKAYEDDTGEAIGFPPSTCVEFGEWSGFDAEKIYQALGGLDE